MWDTLLSLRGCSRLKTQRRGPQMRLFWHLLIAVVSPVSMLCFFTVSLKTFSLIVGNFNLVSAITMGSQGKGLCLFVGWGVKEGAAEVTGSWRLVFQGQRGGRCMGLRSWSWGQAAPRQICGRHENSWWWRLPQKYLRRETGWTLFSGSSEPAKYVVSTAMWLHRLMESRTSQLTMTVPRFLKASLGYLRLSGQLHSFPSFWTCSEFDSLRIWSGFFWCPEAFLLDLI